MRRHWPEYLMEAGQLALFMVSASLVTTLFEHPHSPVRAAIPDALVRRLFTGVGMGLTGAALIYSPWGKQSGAHFNPAVTLTFLRLGKIDPRDAAFYVGAQFVGAATGIALMAAIMRPFVGDPAVNFVATEPGLWGYGWAFAAEVVISFGLMLMVLSVTNTPRLASFTGLFVAVLVATYITVEAPVSGMSMNPARTFGPVLLTHGWNSLWVYLTAPAIGMLTAAEVYTRVHGRRAVRCAKLHHQNDKRCIFRCGYAAPQQAGV